MKRGIDGLWVIIMSQLQQEPGGNSNLDKNLSDEELENIAPWSPKVQVCCVNKS